MKERTASPAGQALIELALLLPLVLVLMLLVLDGGRLFTTWLAVQNAAREGAHLASMRFSGDTSDQAIREVVAGESGEVALLANAAQVSVAYPTPGLVEVTARYPFEFVSPITAALMGGSPVTLSARSAFPVPVRTATPPAITPTAPTPTAVATATATATGTATPPGPTSTATTTATGTVTATPTPVPCTVPVTVPMLAINQGYYFTVTSAGSGTIAASWTLQVRNNIRLNIYAGNPFAGQPNPNSSSPPSGAVAANSGNVTSLSVSSAAVAAGAYAVYFYNQGSPIPAETTATVTYMKARCP